MSSLQDLIQNWSASRKIGENVPWIGNMYGPLINKGTAVFYPSDLSVEKFVIQECNTNVSALIGNKVGSKPATLYFQFDDMNQLILATSTGNIVGRLSPEGFLTDDANDPNLIYYTLKDYDFVNVTDVIKFNVSIADSERSEKLYNINVSACDGLDEGSTSSFTLALDTMNHCDSDNSSHALVLVKKNNTNPRFIKGFLQINIIAPVTAEEMRRRFGNVRSKYVKSCNDFRFVYILFLSLFCVSVIAIVLLLIFYRSK